MVAGVVQSKKAAFILLWSAVIHAFYVLPFVRTDVLENSIVYRGVIIGVMLMLYPLSGWLTDVYFSRYKSMVVGLLAVTLGTTLSTILGFTYPKAVLSGFIIVRIGYWFFEVNAIMYGFEQLETYSTENHRVFIYWFYWTLEIGHFLYGLCVCVSAQFAGAKQGSLITSATLGSLQVVAMVIVVIVMVVYRHRFRDTTVGYHPLKSILSVVRQALKKPIGLEKLKIHNGGLYSPEVIAEVRTFLYILSVICPLSIVYFTEEIYTVATEFRPDNRNESEPIQQCLLTEVPTWTRSMIAVTFIPLYIFVLTPRLITKITHYRWLLLRMATGLLFAICSTLALFGIQLNVYLRSKTSLNELTHACVDEQDISYYWLIIPEVLNGFSVVVVFSTALEFICAQSSSGVRGLLIAIWFALDGFNKVLTSTQEIWHLDCNIFYYVAKIIVTLVFLVIFLIALRFYTKQNRKDYKKTVTASYDSVNYYSSIDNSSEAYDRDNYCEVTDSALNYVRQ